MSTFPNYKCMDGAEHLLRMIATNTEPRIFYCECRKCGCVTDMCLTPPEAVARGNAGWFVSWRRGKGE